jgi:C1A family cysteine protease
MAGVGCGADDEMHAAAGGANTPSHADHMPPLASYERVFAGAPPNASLQDDSKYDSQLARKSTELVALQSPVRDQGRRGVCTIFSTMGLMEHLYKKAGMQNPDFSEQYLQWSVKVQLGSAPTSEGSDNATNVYAISRYGIVDEATDPYNPYEWNESNDPDCVTPTDPQSESGLPTKCYTQGDPPQTAMAARKYKLPIGTYVNTNSIKNWIATRHTAVVVGIDFFFQAWSHGLSTLPIDRSHWQLGYVLYPNQKDITESHKHRAGHGILLVGWDDDLQFQQIDENGQGVVDANGQPVMEKGFYIFKNSWGTTIFGTQNPYGAGYGFISYRYIRDFASAYASTPPRLPPNTP